MDDLTNILKDPSTHPEERRALRAALGGKMTKMLNRFTASRSKKVMALMLMILLTVGHLAKSYHIHLIRRLSLRSLISQRWQLWNTTRHRMQILSLWRLKKPTFS